MKQTHHCSDVLHLLLYPENLPAHSIPASIDRMFIMNDLRQCTLQQCDHESTFGLIQPSGLGLLTNAVSHYTDRLWQLLNQEIQ